MPTIEQNGAAPATGDPLTDLLNGGPKLGDLDLNEQDMLTLFVTEELRGRLVRHFGLAGQLDAARTAAEILDGYTREQIEQAQEDDDPTCLCEGYDCKGECCGPGQCSCTPGFEHAVEMAMAIEENPRGGTAPYLCDGIAVGDQGQPYAECGRLNTHPAHPLEVPRA